MESDGEWWRVMESDEECGEVWVMEIVEREIEICEDVGWMEVSSFASWFRQLNHLSTSPPIKIWRDRLMNCDGWVDCDGLVKDGWMWGFFPTLHHFTSSTLRLSTSPPIHQSKYGEMDWWLMSGDIEKWREVESGGEWVMEIVWESMRDGEMERWLMSGKIEKWRVMERWRDGEMERWLMSGEWWRERVGVIERESESDGERLRVVERWGGDWWVERLRNGEWWRESDWGREWEWLRERVRVMESDGERLRDGEWWRVVERWGGRERESDKEWEWWREMDLMI
jgi:hypothetical protein